MSHHGAQYYLYVRRVEQPLTGVDLSLSLPTTVATLTQVKHFSIHSTFSVFDIKFIQSIRFFFLSDIQETSASLLSSAVIWCFLYIRHEFDTAIVAIFIKKKKTFLAENFPYLFLRRRRKKYNNTTFSAFSIIAFFPNVVAFFYFLFFFYFGYCQVCCVTLSSRAFFQYKCKWSKNACPTFLKKNSVS